MIVQFSSSPRTIPASPIPSTSSVATTSPIFRRARRGARPPMVDYTPSRARRLVDGACGVDALHTEYAVAEYRNAAAVFDLPTDRVPQLADVSDRLTDLTSWRLCAVPGLVSTAEFFGALAHRCFPLVAVRATCVGALLFAAEPDVIHELIGHANSLASPRIAGPLRTSRAGLQGS